MKEKIIQKFNHKSWKWTTLTLIFNISFQFLFFYSSSEYDKKIKYEGDTIDYQTIAVNFTLGHGFMQEGYYEHLSRYNFDISTLDDIPTEEYSRIIKTRNFLRNPVYPLFLSSIYFISGGVNPYFVRVTQLFLLVLSSSLLIVVFKLIKSNIPIVKGIISSWLFLILTYSSAEEILTEPLLSFIFVFLLIGLILYYQKQNVWLIGILFGVSLLAKGIFYLIFLSFILFEVIQFFRKRDVKVLKSLFKVTAISFLIIMPYVIWQNRHFSSSKELSTLSEAIIIAENSKSSSEFLQQIIETEDKDLIDKIDPLKEVIVNSDIKIIKHYLKEWFENRSKNIFIVTQGLDVLLACNNELCTDGLWHKEWINNPNIYYNKVINNDSNYLKVLEFYIANPKYILPIFINKFANSFLVGYLSILCVFLIIFTGLNLIKKAKLKISALVLSFCCFLYVLIFSAYPLKEHQLLIGGTIIFFMFFALYKHYKSGCLILNQTFITVFMGVLFVIFIFYGAFRIILPFYLLFSLLVVELSEQFIVIFKLKSKFVKKSLK